MLIGWQPWYIRRIPRVWQNMYFYCSNYFGNRFIIAISHLWGLWYIANIPWLRAVFKYSALRRVYEQSLAVVYWPYTTPPRALLLKYHTLVKIRHYIKIYKLTFQFFAKKYSNHVRSLSLQLHPVDNYFRNICMFFHRRGKPVLPNVP